jgi:hypothetical protein
MDPFTSIVSLAGISIAALGGLFIKSKEGFQTVATRDFRDYVETGGSRYNQLTQLLDPIQNALIPLNSTQGEANEVIQRVQSALQSSSAENSDNNLVLSLNPPSTDLLPRRDADEDLLAMIDFCNKKPTTTNTPFTDTRFAQNCGVCVRSGVDEKGNRFVGRKGLYISSMARANALRRQEEENLFFVPAEPTLARCEGAPNEPTFALNASDLSRFEERENCRNTKSLDGDCGKCFEEETYTFVGSRPELASLTLSLQGEGSYNLTLGNRRFQGNLSQTPTNIRADSVTEGTNISLTVNEVQRGTERIQANVAGFLIANLPNDSQFTMPLNRIFETDQETGSKPRFSGQLTEIPTANEPAAFLQPGRDKTKMTLVGQIPFTFLTSSEFATLDCNDNPLQTKVTSLSKPVRNPCFQPGQTPGSYNDECLRQILLDNGCNDRGSLYRTPSSLNTSNGAPQTIQNIVNRVKQIASRDGFFNTESQMCSGRTIDTPCQPFQNDPGAPIHVECLTALYNNTGVKQPRLGSTYTASLQFQNETPSEPNLFCSPQGQLNPMLPNGSINTNAVTRLQQIGLQGFQGQRGVAAVKAFLDNQLKIAIDPNVNAYTDEMRRNAILGCFGTIATPNRQNQPEVFAVGPSYQHTREQAQAVCARFGAQVATEAQLQNAQRNGADWCFTAWVANSTNAQFPITTSIQAGCGNGRRGVIRWTPPNKQAGVNCFGYKPPQTQASGVRPFSSTKWSQYS